MPSHKHAAPMKPTAFVAMRRKPNMEASVLKLPVTQEGLPDEQSLLHELQALKFELTKKNCQLRQAEAKAEAAARSVGDFLDSVPVGCLTLSNEGNICRANLAAATMLGTNRSSLPGLRLSALVSTESQPDLDKFLLGNFQAAAGAQAAPCQLRLAEHAGTCRYVRLYGRSDESGGGWHVAMTDVSAVIAANRHNAELAARRKS